MGMHKGLIGQSEGGGSVKPTYEDKTLGDYIARKTRQDAFDQVAQEKRLTFDEWYNRYYPPCERPWPFDTYRSMCLDVWKAAQENK